MSTKFLQCLFIGMISLPALSQVRLRVTTYEEMLNQGRSNCGYTLGLEYIGGFSTVLENSGSGVVVLGGGDGRTRATNECNVASSILSNNNRAAWACVITDARGLIIGTGDSTTDSYSASRDAFDNCLENFSDRACSQGQIPCFKTSRIPQVLSKDEVLLKDIPRSAKIVVKKDLNFKHGSGLFKDNLEGGDADFSTDSCSLSLAFAAQAKATIGDRFNIHKIESYAEGSSLIINLSGEGFFPKQLKCYTSNKLSNPGRPLTVGDFKKIMGNFLSIEF